jgi:hypothetical protein
VVCLAGVKLFPKSVASWHLLAAVFGFAAAVTWVAHGSAAPKPAPVPAWLAARWLPANTRISAGDLRRPAFPTPLSVRGLADPKDLAGKYLYSEHKQGDAVWLTDLVESPVIPVKAATTVLFFKTETLGGARSSVNAGSRVRICPESGACDKSEYRVEAVLGADAASLAVRIPDPDLDRVRGIAKPSLIVAGL